MNTIMIALTAATLSFALVSVKRSKNKKHDNLIKNWEFQYRIGLLKKKKEKKLKSIKIAKANKFPQRKRLIKKTN